MKHVHIDELDYIDHACLEMLSSWDKQHASNGGSLRIEWQELVDRFHRAVPGSAPRTAAQDESRQSSKRATMASMDQKS